MCLAPPIAIPGGGSLGVSHSQVSLTVCSSSGYCSRKELSCDTLDSPFSLNFGMVVFPTHVIFLTGTRKLIEFLFASVFLLVRMRVMTFKLFTYWNWHQNFHFNYKCVFLNFQIFWCISNIWKKSIFQILLYTDY